MNLTQIRNIMLLEMWFIKEIKVVVLSNLGIGDELSNNQGGYDKYPFFSACYIGIGGQRRA